MANAALAGRTGKAVAQSSAVSELVDDLKSGRLRPGDPDSKRAAVDKLVIGLLCDPKVTECLLDALRSRELDDAMRKRHPRG